QQGQTADQPQFLGDHRKDEIGLFLWKKAQMALGAGQKTLAEHAPGAKGDLGLENVIPGSERVAVGVEERVEPRLLVIAQKGPGERRRYRRADGPDREHPDTDPAEKADHDARGEQD